jgi:hypothetical protein
MNPILYRLKQLDVYIGRLLQKCFVKASGLFAVTSMTSRLDAVVIPADGSDPYDLGLLSIRVVTNAGVAFMGTDFNAGTTEITNMNFHDSGTGVAAENVTDTDLGTPAGPTTRATGTQSNPASGQYRTVGTITYTSTLAITEHGIFNQAARGGGSTLWDRSVFSAINVNNGDSIQFTYTLTINAGG